MKIEKKCTTCEHWKNDGCKNCGEYCMRFNTGEPYITVPIVEQLQTIIMINSKDVEYEVFNSSSGKIVADELITYYDPNFEEFRIFPSELYEKITIEYNETN